MTSAGVPAFALVALNVADAALSWWLFSAGIASEANPVMALAWRLGPGAFVAGKVALVSLAVLLLWRARNPWAESGLRACCCVYASVVALEVGMLIEWFAGAFVGAR